MAEKGSLHHTTVWRELLDSYEFTPDDVVSARVYEWKSLWKSIVIIDGKEYTGEYPTLEEAFKATADLLYRHAKEFWLRMDTRVVTEPWAHTLPEIP
jgi:hypothetical protein